MLQSLPTDDVRLVADANPGRATFVYAEVMVLSIQCHVVVAFPPDWKLSLRRFADPQSTLRYWKRLS